MFQLRGGAALSEFRLKKLLLAVQAQVPEVSKITTVFEHFVDLHTALDSDKQAVLGQLLRYGSRAGAADEGQPAGTLLLVVPRPGTISPWSSKATDIAHNCGLAEIRRIERGTAYYFASVDGAALGDHQLSLLRPLIHDRMVEQVMDSLEDADALFMQAEPAPMITVDILGGRAALACANDHC